MGFFKRTPQERKADMTIIIESDFFPQVLDRLKSMSIAGAGIKGDPQKDPLITFIIHYISPGEAYGLGMFYAGLLIDRMHLNLKALK